MTKITPRNHKDPPEQKPRDAHSNRTGMAPYTSDPTTVSNASSLILGMPRKRIV